MWVVYLIDASGSDWGHRYFNLEENARKHLKMLEGIHMYSVPYINKILTEDSPSRAGALED